MLRSRVRGEAVRTVRHDAESVMVRVHDAVDDQDRAAKAVLPGAPTVPGIVPSICPIEVMSSIRQPPRLAHR